MAKSKTKKAREKDMQDVLGEQATTVAFQVRFDGDLHGSLKAAADTAGISLNQLIQGICRGALAHLVQGEPAVRLSGYVSVTPQRGCVFFGRPGIPCDDDEAAEYYRAGKEPPAKDNGVVWFGLDFTNRGFVRYQPR